MAKKALKRREWTAENVRTLKTMAQQRKSAASIARALRRTEGTTRQKAFWLGVSLDTLKGPLGLQRPLFITARLLCYHPQDARHYRRTSAGRLGGSFPLKKAVVLKKADGLAWGISALVVLPNSLGKR